MEFIKANMVHIEQAKGYIFFKDCASANSAVYLDVNYVRNRFRYYVKLADVDQVYDISEESDSRTSRRLHRLTTHSLRHHAITSFSKQTNGNVVLTSRFARYASPETTMIYISTKKEELYGEIGNMTMDTRKVQVQYSITEVIMHTSKGIVDTFIYVIILNILMGKSKYAFAP